jgi:predicted ATPase/class 3 adenylate cyclase
LTNPPGGNITFLFTDIEGSTKLAQQYPESLPLALEIHHAILKEAIESNKGFVFEVIGDAFCAAFENAIDAVNACYIAQVKLNAENWKEAEIKVRMGIHSGIAEWNGKRYMGYLTLARTQRVMSAAHGGQVLISEDAYIQLTSNESSVISYRDLGERRLKDLIQPLKIFQLISKDLPSDFLPLATLDSRPNNLPVQLTSFIGREKEIDVVKELLNKTHLLTLTGPGGAGKTRLSLQTGADVIDEFSGGVWFIELASLIDPALLPQKIIIELGIKEESKKALEETLSSYLKDKEILLILDNCEHLIESCAALSEKLLKACPKLKIIATSREALKCTGEQVYSVSSLKTPNVKDKLTPEQLTQYESVRLFIERALTVNPRFRVTNENAPALSGICSQLDGIPLAIELAAARIKVLSVEKIFERLNNRFSLLTGGVRTALPRQQTLKALIDWSYDLLSEKEKMLWSRLSVFNDGWTLDAAEEICADDKIDKDSVLDLLALLAEKSILILEESGERYHILETLKRYGEGKLEEANESMNIYSKYLNYFVELSEFVEPKLTGDEVHLWLDKLEKEHGNLQSAIEWALKNGFQNEGFRLAGALGLFWDIRGYYSIGRGILESMLNNVKEISKPVLGKALVRAGLLAQSQGDYSQAMKFYEQSLVLYLGQDDKNSISTVLRSMGNVVYEQGDYAKARKLIEAHLEFKREIGDKHSIADSLNDLGNMAYDQGDYEQARNFHEESLALRREIGYKRGIAGSLNNLGNVAYNLGEYEKAQKLQEESLAIKRELGDKKGITTSLHNSAILAYANGDLKKAKSLFEETLTLVREIGDKTGIADSLHDLGFVEYEQGNFDQASKFYEESLAVHRETGNKLGSVYCITGLAAIACKVREFKWAASLLGFVETALLSMNTVFERDGKILYEQTLRNVKSELSVEEFNEHWSKGKDLTIEEAADLARSAED